MSSGRRIGRPRIRRGVPAGDPPDEILAAASRLFGERGVTGTTMAQIAAGAGLQQSSLYYYFRSKEEILARLVAEANVVPLELAQRVRGEDVSPAVRLYRFVRGDVVALCLLPFDINEVHRYASRDRERFAGYWKERRTLQSTLAGIIREGIVDGSLRRVNARLAALTLISNDEAGRTGSATTRGRCATRWRSGRRSPSCPSPACWPTRQRSPTSRRRPALRTLSTVFEDASK